MTKDDEANPTPSPTQPSPNTSYHPTLSVNNIKNDIPLILYREKVHYFDWVESLKIYYHACDVLDHIDPTEPRRSDTLWPRVDSVVKSGSLA